jgi:large subunit ribosomal protein L19
MHPKIKQFEEEQMKKGVQPRLNIGDNVRISVKVDEGDKTRTQMYEGVIIKKQGSGLRQSFTVRRISFGEGVERSFPVHSPTVQKVELIRSGKVRRAKLFYLRKSKGKANRIEEGKREDVQTPSQS